MKHRDNTFDVMKGIGILAMVIGHCPIPRWIESLIFVWHIPMFFIISGYFYRQYNEKAYIKKNLRHLVLPYLVTSLVIILFSFAKQLISGKGYTKEVIIATLVGNGTVNNPTLGKYSIGAIWFLLALFWCRIIFNLLHSRITSRLYFSGILISLASISTYAGTFVYLPTDILQGLGALLFFYIGYLTRIYNLFDYKADMRSIIFIIILAFLSISTGSMSMVRCYYGYWPINYLAAIAVTYLIFHISKHMSNCIFLSWCGRVSIVILCIHIIELSYLPINHIQKMFNISYNFDVLIHLFVTISMSYFVLLISPVKKLFSML